MVEILFWYCYYAEVGRAVGKDNKRKIEEEVSPIATNFIEQKGLWQKGEAFITVNTDIARNYIEESNRYPAMESTTRSDYDGPWKENDSELCV
jgi:hypothetical protein